MIFLSVCRILSLGICLRSVISIDVRSISSKALLRRFSYKMFMSRFRFVVLCGS